MSKPGMKSDELAILKATSFKITDDKLAIIAVLYHTEKDPTTNKCDRSKTVWRTEGRVIDISALKAEIDTLKANPTGTWKWPNVSGWNIIYCDDGTNAKAAKWLASKLAKAVNLETGIKILNGGRKNKSGEYDIDPKCKYELEGYTCNGQTFSPTAEALVALPSGSTFSKIAKQPKPAVA